MARYQGKHLAVGYWGRDPNAILNCYQQGEKTRVALDDELRTNGRPAWLWQPINSAAEPTTGTPCTCDKNTGPGADARCFSCYGVRLVPGFLKFLHETVWYSSSDHVNGVAATLTDATVNTRLKPNRIVIAAGETTGVVETPDLAFTNPLSDVWEVELAAFRRAVGDTVALEFSTDAGTTWTAVTLTQADTLALRGDVDGITRPIGSGFVRFRVTLTRLLATTESPSFEVVRLRRVRSEHVRVVRASLTPGQILIQKTWEQETVNRTAGRGRQVMHDGDRAKTAPLDLFDSSLTAETPRCALDDRAAGPHPMFEYATSVRTGQRYAVTNVFLDNTVGEVFNHQSFTERRVQDGEAYALIF